MAACAQQVAAAPAAAASAASGGGFGPLAAARKQKPCATCHDLFEFSQNMQRCCGKACKAALNAALIAAKRANVVESLRLTSDTSTLQKMTSALAAGRAAAVAGDGLPHPIRAKSTVVWIYMKVLRFELIVHLFITTLASNAS
jgi:hypothetical protein